MSQSENIIERCKEILGGIPVFEGTRVPVTTFFEHLEAGSALNEFLEDVPTITRQLTIDMLATFKDHLLHP